MNRLFFKHYLKFFALFTVIILLVNTFLYRWLYSFSKTIGYYGQIPQLLIIGIPAYCCMLSVIIARIMTKSHDYIEFEKLRYSKLAVVLLFMFILSYYVYAFVSGGMFDYIKHCYIDLIILLIAFMTGAYLVWFIVSTIKIIKSNKNREEINQDIFGIFFMLFSIATSLILLLCGIVLAGTGCNMDDARFTIFTEFVIIFLLSLICAGLCFKIIPLWNKKTTPCVLLVFFIGFIYLLGICILFICWNQGDSYKYTNRYKKYSSNTDNYSENYTIEKDVIFSDVEELREYDEIDVEEKIDSIHLDFLWPNADKRNVNDSIHAAILWGDDIYCGSGSYNGIPAKLPTGAYAYLPNDSTGYLKTFYVIINYLDKNRSKVDVASLFLTYKDVILKAVPEESFHENEYDKIWLWLNASYYDLLEYNSEEEYDYTKFSKVYDLMKKNESDIENLVKEDKSASYFHQLDEKLYDNIQKYASNNYLARFIVDGSVDTYKVIWAYSFWGRRYSEGTIQMTRKLLDEISETYSCYDEGY